MRQQQPPFTPKIASLPARSVSPASASSVEKKEPLSAEALALKIRARVIDESLADDILASRRAGVDFTARMGQASHRQHGSEGVNRNSLLALLFLRDEAKETNDATRIEFETLVNNAAVSKKAKLAALATGLGDSPEERQAGEKLFAKLIGDNAKACRQLAGEGLDSPANRDIARRLREEGRDVDRLIGWAKEAQAFFSAREQWERVVERVLPEFSLRELIEARLPWESLVLVPFSIRQSLFEEAKRDPALWVDCVDHTPLSAICLMAGRPFAQEERTALLGQLRAARAPAASSNENNPFFVLAMRAFEKKPLDEELCRALRAAGHTPSTPGRNGETAMDLAQGGLSSAQVGLASTPSDNARKETAFWEKIFARLEHADLQADILPSESEGAENQTLAAPARIARRI